MLFNILKVYHSVVYSGNIVIVYSTVSKYELDVFLFINSLNVNGTFFNSLFIYGKGQKINK